MSEIILRLGELDPSQHLAEEARLPVLQDVPGVPTAKRALDAAGTFRRGVLLVGPKGGGKSVALDQAEAWLREVERQKHERDETYRKRRVLRVGDLRDADYRQSGVHIAAKLSGRYTDRVRGRKKAPAEVRADVVELLRKMNYAVLIIDEAERCSDDTFLFLRDLMADAEASSTDRYTEANEKVSAGVGVVVAGAPEVQTRLAMTEEAGERWALTLAVPDLTLDVVIRVYDAWLPRLGEHVRAIGGHAWENYLEGLLWLSEAPSFRLIENHARLFAWYMVRMDRKIKKLSDIPFHLQVFEKALEEVRWARTSRPGRGSK